MTGQSQAFNLEITGSTETVKALEFINKLIRENNEQMKALQKTGDATAKTIQSLSKENAQLKTVSENVTKELAATDARMKELLATNKQASKEYKNLKQTKAELVEQEKKVNKELEANTRQLNANIEKNTKAKEAVRQYTLEQEKNKLEATKLRKELKEQVKAFDDLHDNIPKDSIIGMGREVSKLTKQFNEMSKAERESAKGQELQKHLLNTKTQFDQLNRSVGNYKSSVGDYRNAINEAGKGLVIFGAFALGAFGVGSAMSVASNLISGAKQTITEFNQSIIDLGNDTTITNEHLEQLTQIAIDLSGGRLGTSATDLTKIFGFLANASPGLSDNVKLLEEVSENVNILSKAEKVNAEIVSGAVTTAAQNFNISLSDSAKIVDTLAHASDQGKAKLPELADAIKEGGVIAGQVGIPFKEYLDIIEATSKIGLKGTDTAGKLNKVLSVLAKTGEDELNPALHPMSEILETLDKRFGATAGSADALQKVTELFSSKNASFVLTLIQQKEVLQDLNKLQVESGGALGDALKNADSLKGKVAELTGEWEKFILKVDEGEGAVSHFFRVYVEGAIGFVRLLRGEFRSAVQEEFDNLQSKLLAKGIEDSILGNLNENFDAAKRAAENLFKPIQDETDKTKDKVKDLDKDLKEFAKGSIGFINQQISKLNQQLQNTTSETVITTTTNQIIQLQAVVAKLQAEIDKGLSAAQKEQNKKDLNAPSRQVADPFAFTKKPTFGFNNLFGNNEDQQATVDAQNFEAEKELNAKRAEENEKNRLLELEKNQMFLDAKLAQEQMYNDSIATLISDFGNVFASLFDDQRNNSKDLFKDVLLITLKFAEQQIQIAALAANTQAAIAAIANPILLAKLALQKGIITALIGVAFGALRGIVSGFEEGGIVNGGIPYKQPGTSDNVLIHAKKGEVVLNEKQQSKIKRLAGAGIFSQAGVKGFKRSPMNNKIVNQNTNNVSAYSELGADSIDQLSRSVADAIINKNREVERKRLVGA